MNKKLNAFLRILTVVAAVAAGVFAFLHLLYRHT